MTFNASFVREEFESWRWVMFLQFCGEVRGDERDYGEREVRG